MKNIPLDYQLQRDIFATLFKLTVGLLAQLGSQNTYQNRLK